MNDFSPKKDGACTGESSRREEPMDASDLLSDDYDEEGEIHSSGDEKDNYLSSKNVEGHCDGVCRANSIFESLATRTKTFDKTETVKKIERAKRFSVPLVKIDIEVNNENLTRLYSTLGIDKESERHYRFNAVHMRGTQDMSTEDVFEYFSSYTPLNIEWINDVSCNVVWLDDISAARALLNLSKEIKNLDKIHLNGDPFERDLKERHTAFDFSFDSEAIDARLIKAAIPPGNWRIGTPSEKSSAILLRFATRSDRKQKNAEKNSEYYKRYGNPHFGNIRGLVSNSLRSEMFKKIKKYSGKSQFDDAEEAEAESERRGRRKNPWGHLAQEWNEQDQNLRQSSSDVKSRLSLKRRHSRSVQDLRMSINHKSKRTGKFQRAIDSKSDSEPSDSNPSNLDDENGAESRVKLPRMKMYADEERIASNHVKFSASKSGSSNSGLQAEDLRNKINKKKRTKKMLNSYARNRVKNSGPDENASDYDNDERETTNWALEQYADLRESLEQNKKQKYKGIGCGDKDNEQNYSDSDELHSRHLRHRSPLQIEIENDEYFENDSDNVV